MKVILLQDVARMGKKGEIREVPDGHAINFLIPRKQAVPATPQNMKRQTALDTQKKENTAALQEAFAAAAAKLATTSVELFVDANDQGHLFQSVKPVDIAKCLQGYGIEVDPKTLILEFPVKEIGTYTVAMAQHGDQIQFPLVVLAK